MSDSGWVSKASLLALGAAVAFAAGAAAQTPVAAGPHIVARPDNVMVNATTTLTGRGFPPKTKVALAECGAASWIAPQDPCDTANTVTVTTNLAGGFSTPFKVQLCPRTAPPVPPVTKETCYIGEPHPTGIDTIALLGASKVTVTYP
jgi:hypothetical protein